MKYLPLSAALALAFTLAGCAATEPTAGGQKLAREEAYAPVGTMIPRKNGNGGAAPVGTVDRTQMENARTMEANGTAGIGKQ